ncbi:FtsX-like permease family protein [uncultured Clostridium sp.]|uniref:ABC transporter permease n=1 Tax=uncultured Clostridium sp. TaxID=59620 RepID=UPI003216AD3F
MKSFWGIVPRYIIKNKNRVLFMAIGIVLSTTLIVSLSIMKESFLEYRTNETIKNSGGNFDIMIQSKGYGQLDNIKKEEIVDKSSIVTPLGTSKIEDTKYSIDIRGYEENISEFINLNIVDGRMPCSDNEIAIESWILDYLPKTYKIGDKIKLDYSVQYEGSQGFEVLNDSDEFNIVGIFEYTCGINSEVGKAWVTSDFAEKKLEEHKLKEKNIVYEEYIYLNPNYSINKGQLLLASTSEYLSMDFISNNFKVNLLLAIKVINLICNVLFIVVGVVVSINIYNTFMVSVAERKKEFGMIRAIGASPRRIKAMVLAEGLILGVIFIPIGLIVGNILIKSIMIVLGYEQINSLLTIPISGVVVSVIIGLFSIILGSYFPAQKASKVSPMEAIQGNEEVNVKKNKLNLQTMNCFGKQIKFHSKMAIINIKRNKKKFLTSVISLSITIIMLISVFYLISESDPVNKLKKSYGDADFKILSYSRIGITDEELDKISKIEGVKILSKVKESYHDMDITKEMLTDDGYSYLQVDSKRNAFLGELMAKGIYRFYPKINGYSDKQLEELNKWVIDGSINIEEMNKKSTVILAQNLNTYNYTQIKAGDKIKIGGDIYDEYGKAVGYSSKEFEVVAIVAEEGVAIGDGMAKNAIIVSYDVASEELGMTGHQKIDVELDENVNYEEGESQLKGVINGIADVEMESFKEKLAETKRNNVQLIFILYNFVFIVAVVSVINLINIMKMNVITRNKEIGMMRAIGLGQDEVKGMIRIEGFLYGITSSIIGSALGSLLTYFIHKKVVTSTTWEFPIITIMVISIVTIIVTTLSSTVSSRQLFKSSIIDSIRNME